MNGVMLAKRFNHCSKISANRSGELSSCAMRLMRSKSRFAHREEEELEEEQKILSNAERLRELCTLIYGSIKGTDLVGDDFKQPSIS